MKSGLLCILVVQKNRINISQMVRLFLLNFTQKAYFYLKKRAV